MNSKILILFLVLLAILSSSFVSAGFFVVDDTFPFIHFEEVDVSTGQGMTEDLSRIYAEDIYDSNGSRASEDEASEYLSDLMLTEDYTDTGIDKSKPISMDWIDSEEKSGSRCLGVNISDWFFFSKDLTFVLENTGISAERVSTPRIYHQEKVIDEENVSSGSCTEKDVKSDNGSINTVRTCTTTYSIQKKEVDGWVEQSIASSYKSDKARSDTVKVTDGGYYKYCFDTPFGKFENGAFGTKGTVYVEYDGNSYADFQHSSFWNNSFPLRRAINITNNDGNSPLRKWHTIEVSGWNTSDPVYFNVTNQDNFELVCDDSVTTDKVIGNRTKLNASATSKLYPDSTGWYTSNTTFLFRLPNNVTTSSSNTTMCYIYYGLLSFNSTMTNKSNIGLFVDEFNRPNNVALGNGWSESGATPYLEISGNRLQDIGTNGGSAEHNLDTGTCTDCESYTIRYSSNQNAPNTAGSGICVVFDNNGSDIGSNCQETVGKGIALNHADESGGNFAVARADNGATIKQVAGAVSNTTDYFHRVDALDDALRGDYVYYRNESVFINWSSTNSTDTTASTGTKIGIHLVANRVNNTISYIWITRFIRNAPTIALLSAEGNGSNPPTQGYPIINATTYANRSIDNITLFNVSTNDIDTPQTVKNIYQWYRNGGFFPFRNVPMEGGSNSSRTFDYANGSDPFHFLVFGATWNGTGGYDGRGAYEFDGINDYLTPVSAEEPQYDFVNGFSLSAWVKTANNKSAASATILSKANSWNLRQQINTGGNANQIAFTTDGVKDYFSGRTLLNNQWTHIVITMDSSNTTTFYVNGANVTGVTFTSGAILNNNNFFVGQSGLSSNWWNGTIDEVMVFNQTLNPDQVDFIYKNQTNKFHSSLTFRADNITGCIIPNDNTTDGVRNCSLLYINRFPNITSLILNSTSPFNYSNGTINMSRYVVSDADNDPIINRTTWYRNGTIVKAWDNVTYIASSLSNFSKDYNITVVVEIQDVLNDGTPVDGFGTNVTAFLLVINAPAEVSSINITSDLSTNDTNANLTGVFGYSDIDNDLIAGNATKWYRNGTRVSALDNTSIVNKSYTIRLENWTFSAQVFDGDNWSNWKNSSTFFIANSIPKIPIPGPNTSVTTFDISYATNCTNSTDLDGDSPLNYEFFLGNTTNYILRQNSSSTVFNFTFEANYTALFNCRANDNISASAFGNPNWSIVFNNSVIFGNRTKIPTTVSSGSNYTFKFNISFNDIAVSWVNATFSIYNYTLPTNAVNDTSLNTTEFNVSAYLPLNSSNYNVSYYWNVSAMFKNQSSIMAQQFGGYSVEATGIIFSSGAGCNGTTNATQWTVWNLTWRDELNLTLQNISSQLSLAVWQQGTPQRLNTTVTFDIKNTSQTFVCITPTNSSIPYQSYGRILYQWPVGSPMLREYYFINTTLDNVTDNIDLYAINSNIGSSLAHIVQDETETPLVGVYIIQERRQEGNNSYYVVGMGKTDDAGQDILYVQRVDGIYRYRIQRDISTILLSQERRITSDQSQLIFTITPDNIFKTLQTFNNDLEYNLSFNNQSNNFTVTFIHHNLGLEESCLEVTRIGISNGTSQVCSSCSKSSGTLTCNIGNGTKGEFIATYNARTNTFTKTIDSIDIVRGGVSSFTTTLGSAGLWYTVIFVGAVTFAGLFSPVAAFFLMICSIGAAMILGLFNLSFMTFMLLALVGAYIFSKVKT